MLWLFVCNDDSPMTTESRLNVEDGDDDDDDDHVVVATVLITDVVTV